VGKPAYIFSGTADAVVYQCVMESVRSQLSQLGANVASEFSLPAAHGWVVDGRDFARPYSFPRCGNPGADFIEDCGFDLSSAMLSHLKGPLWPLATAKPASFYWVRQSAFVPDGVRPAQVRLGSTTLAPALTLTLTLDLTLVLALALPLDPSLPPSPSPPLDPA
jgi:hypothetical protein